MMKKNVFTSNIIVVQSNHVNRTKQKKRLHFLDLGGWSLGPNAASAEELCEDVTYLELAGSWAELGLWDPGDINPKMRRLTWKHP